MIKNKTVLIFGAGVSHPYGYPIGQELVNQIIESLEYGKFNFLLNYGYTKFYLNRFASDLESSSLPSIDIFLENRQDYFEIGKICIVAQLLSKEDPNIFSLETAKKEGIYSKIFYEMMNGGNWERIKENKIAFVTFNYDRSLEHFLFKSIKASSGQSDERVSEIVNGIELLHFYGSLPKLNWQALDGLPYGCFYDMENISTNFDAIKKASEGIVILGEKQVKFENSEIAFDKLTEAERIVFLGFGYHEMNIKRLRLDELMIFDKDLPNNFGLFPNRRQCVFRGNAFGLGEAKRKEISQRLKIYLPTISLRDNAFIDENILLN